MGIFIFGAGGAGREVLCLIREADAFWQQESNPAFVVDDEYHPGTSVMGVPVIRRSEWSPGDGPVVVAVGDCRQRRNIVASISGAHFATVIHPTAIISDGVELGPGSVVAAHAILTCNIRIGAHAHLNIATSISHDCVAGDFLTMGPGARVCGNCTIGDGVYIGANASVREKTKIGSRITVGMGAAVVCDLLSPGAYVGAPAKPRPLTR